MDVSVYIKCTHVTINLYHIQLEYITLSFIFAKCSIKYILTGTVYTSFDDQIFMVDERRMMAEVQLLLQLQLLLQRLQWTDCGQSNKLLIIYLQQPRSLWQGRVCIQQSVVTSRHPLLSARIYLQSTITITSHSTTKVPRTAKSKDSR